MTLWVAFKQRGYALASENGDEDVGSRVAPVRDDGFSGWQICDAVLGVLALGVVAYGLYQYFELESD